MTFALCVNPAMLTWLAESTWREFYHWVGGATTDPPARPSVLLGNSFLCLWSAHSPQGPHLITGPLTVMILFKRRWGYLV